MNNTEDNNVVRIALLKAASELFLEKDFHSASLREISKRANTSSAMINYYFKSKHGLFEEMIKSQCSKILNAYLTSLQESDQPDYTVMIKSLIKVYRDNPGMAQFTLKTMSIQSGPGSQYLKDCFNFEKHFVQQRMQEMKQQGNIRENVDSEVIRILMICVTLLPGYMEAGMKNMVGNEEYQEFEEKFVNFVGQIIQSAVYTDENILK